MAYTQHTQEELYTTMTMLLAAAVFATTAAAMELDGRFWACVYRCYSMLLLLLFVAANLISFSIVDDGTWLWMLFFYHSFRSASFIGWTDVRPVVWILCVRAYRIWFPVFGLPTLSCPFALMFSTLIFGTTSSRLVFPNRFRCCPLLLLLFHLLGSIFMSGLAWAIATITGLPLNALPSRPLFSLFSTTL